MTKTERQEIKRKEWENRITQYRASGKSVTEWCAANNVSAERLWYWLRKYKTNKDTPLTQPNQWLRAKVCEQPPMDNSLTVRVGKAQIEVKEGFDPNLLSQVVRTLVVSC